MNPMKHPPIKRHASLQPLSRDHYVGLVQAQHLVRSASNDRELQRRALGEFQVTWRDEIAVHFDDEERLLLNLIPDPTDRQRLLDEHARLRTLADEVEAQMNEPHPAWIRTLGELLNDHIRWEERELFPKIESTASASELSHLTRETAAVEAARPRAQCRTRSKPGIEKE